MGFNSGKIKVQSSAKKKTKNDAWKNDVVVDPRGQWARPGEVTKVPSGNITMQGVPYPVMGVDEYGNQQLMMPGGEYMFPGNMVTEYPMMQMGGMTVKPRQGVRPNSNGTESTHLMRREYVPNRGWVAFPSLFQNDDGQWVDLGSQYGDQWKPIYDEAIKRGEVYDFGEDEKAAIDFADKGSWKKQVGGQAPDPYFQQLENINQYQQQLATERERVDLATQNLLTQAERKDVGNIPTRTDLGWIKQGKYFCNSHTCELMSDAGYTTQEGKPQPLIPGNMQMKGNLEKYGFVPVQQSQWKPGDFVQEELYKTRDYQGNEFSPRWVPSHSTIYSGTDEKGERYYYNAPGGARSDYANTPVHGHGVEGKDWRMKGYRYVGNMPQYEQQIADAQAKLRTLSPQKIAPIEASIPVPQQVPQLARAPESTKELFKTISYE
jgi:hypothetical protein